MLRNTAEGHVRRAVKLRFQLPRQTKKGQWVQPGYEWQFSNEDLLFDFFEEAMASVLLLFAAMDAWANEQLPEDTKWTTPGGDTISRAQVEGRIGLEKRLTQVLPVVTGCPDPSTSSPEEWKLLVLLKELRDAIAHVHRDETYTTLDSSPEHSVFSRLLAADFTACVEAIDRLMEE